MITPGATPKVIMSANESNCLPISPDIFSLRAKNPSKKSNSNPAKIANGAKSILPANAKTIAKTPHNKFAAVKRFGILNIVR